MRMLADPAEVPDAYDAEVAVSVLVGTMVQAGAQGDILARALLDVTDELVRGDQAHAYPALRTLAVIGPPETSAYTAQAADRIAATAGRAASAPEWTGNLGRVTPGNCVIAADAYGETQALLCEFAYADGTRPHGIFAVIDATWHGAITKLAIDDSPAKTRHTMEKQARRNGGELREMPTPKAGATLLAGIEAFLRHGRPPGVQVKDEDYGLLCASLGVARSRGIALAGSDAAPVPDDIMARWPADARQRLASEFLASPHARDLQDPISRKMPFLLSTICVSQLGCDPVLIGPLLLERMLLHVLPATLIGPDRFGAAISPFLRAWTGWLADRHQMPGRQRRQLTFRLEYLLRRFPALWNGPNASPLRRYVRDLPDEVASDGETIIGVIERRTFAVPEPGRRGDGLAEASSGGPARHADELDAATEPDRALVTLIGLSQRGLPRHRFSPYLAVTEQLWANQPSEAWAAAQRMRAAGLSREAILDRLARTWEAADGADQAAYIAALARLAQPGQAEPP
jgi:hypothetical protein